MLSTALGIQSAASSLFEQFRESDIRILTELIEQANNLEPAVPSHTLRKLLIAELTQRDPNATIGLVDSLPLSERNELIGIIFSNWFDQDLLSALQATERLPLPSWRAAVRTILKLDPDQSRQIEELAVLRGFSNELSDLQKANEAQELLSMEPSDAWHALTRDSVSNFEQARLLRELLSSWFYQDGYAVFDQLHDSRHRLDSYQSPGAIVGLGSISS